MSLPASASSTHPGLFHWSWPKLKFSVQIFSGPNVQYTLLFFGRHGESWHDFANSFYSTPAWGNCWSKLNGNSTITWGPDAEVTPSGVEQVANTAAAWRKELPTGPATQVLYSSQTRLVPLIAAPCAPYSVLFTTRHTLYRPEVRS